MYKHLFSGFLLTVALASCGQTSFSPPTSESTEPSSPSAASPSEQVKAYTQIWKLSDEQVSAIGERLDSFIKAHPQSTRAEQEAELRRLLDDQSGMTAQEFPSTPEALACVGIGLIDCYKARQDSVTAVRTAAAVFYWQAQQDLNERNAFQHAFWNALMAKHIGVSQARAISSAHERGSASYGTVASSMDLWNNEEGLGIGGSYPTASDVDSASQVVSNMKLGYMRILNRPGQTYLVASNAYLSTWQPITSIRVVY